MIGEAKVVAWATTALSRPTGGTVHRIGGCDMGSAPALAICQYPGDEGFDLLYCDLDWNPITDTWHQSLDDAKSQATFEYQGIESQ